MTSQPLLAICIPTYRRTKEILRNLELMDFQDSRVVFVVSSNCEDKLLSEYCNGRIDIRYSENKDNKGFIENFSKVLGTEISLFSLVLSDEDFIDSENVAKLLGHLEVADPSRMQFFVPTDDYFSLSSMKKLIGKKALSYLDVLLTNPFIPTYMSGFVFPSERKRFLGVTFKANSFNYYPHLILRNRLLGSGIDLHIPSSVLITRGVESDFRDEEVNYVSLQVGVDRTNYFLSHYKEMDAHNWFLEVWVACLVLAQTIPGLREGYLSLKVHRDGNTKFIGIEHRFSSGIETKVSHRISALVVFLSHVYRRLFTH